MAPSLSLKPAEVSRLSEDALKGWIETCVTRMGIPIASCDESTDQYDAEVTLGGDYEHCRVTYARGSYAVWAFNPFHGEDHIIDGTGELEKEVRKARELSFTTNE
jgi:hypothetical protein